MYQPNSQKNTLNSESGRTFFGHPWRWKNVFGTKNDFLAEKM